MKITEPTNNFHLNLVRQLWNAAELTLKNIFMLKKGTKVEWKWGKGKGIGKVETTFTEPVQVEIKGTLIRRKASPKNPAYLIAQENGNVVLKLESQLSHQNGPGRDAKE